MEQLNRDLKRVVGYFRKRQDVSALYVYGGLSNGEYSGLNYGVGVLSSMRDPLALQSLELDCRVHCEDVLDVVCLDTASMGLRHHVARCGSVVHERNMAHRVMFERKAMNSFDDRIALGYGLGSEVASEIVLDMLEDEMGF
ncbi:MAG: hypothetical protein KAR83_01785 [Thermodesulfovibrionales bacterium]|nr:hypothetical protein [Thermodesulfovibrionales bacterium]